MDLFRETAPWEDAAAHVQVFKLYGGWVADFSWHTYGTTHELEQIIGDLNRRGIALGFEAGPLVPTDTCGRGIEGFFGPEEGLRIVQRLRSLGAEVRYVTLDEPFAFGHIYDGPGACHWPAEKIAAQVEDYISTIHSVYPEAIVGDIEPLWAGVDPEQLIEWLDSYQAVTGTPLSFLHLDLDYSRPDWAIAAKRLEDAARERGVEFGIFYLGNEGDSSDAAWLNGATERAYQYEAVAGGEPDHVIFQSWHDKPDHVLPETNPDTFTGLIRRYFRPRTHLDLELDTPSMLDTVLAAGTLTDASGAGLSAATVELTMAVLDGPGARSEYTIRGIVPVGAVRSDVGFRVNTECGCQGTSDFVLYEVEYIEAGGTANMVPNGDFSQGMTGWGAWGAGTIRVEPSDAGGDRMLRAVASLGQDAAINSSPFPVTAGAAYTLTFVARIAPASLGSGYFDITFQDAQAEFVREMIQLAPAVIDLGTATTDAQGRYEILFGPLPAGTLLVGARYPGSQHWWPAYASFEVSLP